MRNTHTILLCALLLAGTTAIAQHSSTPEARLAASIPVALRPYLRYMAAARQTAAPAATPLTAKTTAMRERLIGYSSYDDLGDLSDSGRFVYLGTRGSFHGENELNSYRFSYVPEDEHLSKKEGVTLYSGGGPLNILCDTAVMINSDLEVSQTMAMQYNTANKLQRYRVYTFSGGVADERDEYRYFYNSAGQATRLEDDYAPDGSTPLTPNSVYYAFYNSAGKPVLDSQHSLVGDPTGKIAYTYNSANLLTNATIYQEISTGTYQAFISIDYTHDASGRLKTSTMAVDFMGTGTPESILKDSFGYTGTYAFPTFFRLFQYDGLDPVPVVDYTYHVNSAGLRDTLTYTDYSTGSPEYAGKTWYTYTAGKNLKTSGSEDVSGSPGESETYHYELYDDVPNSVPETAAAAGVAATAYPNPVSSALTLRWDAATAGPRIQILLADAAGRTLLTQTIAAVNGKAEVDMSRYAPGLYTVTLSAADGTPLQSLKVTKQ